ncbi:MAG TPA: DUF2232 domain-containing protein [Dictyobacter sp.]|jgi:hypothetical protein|nr:DUF2232 domain-containing protein [Dictyobacter sp.]
MIRNLKAIEIAEGALLADIAVVFQCIAAFLPVGAGFFIFLGFVVFAILVLRRGFYVGVMGMCVAMFLMSIIIGPQFIITAAMQGMGGIFLGVLMRHRFPHIPLVVLGAICGAGFLLAVVLLSGLLTGLSVQNIVHSLQQPYNALIASMNTFTARFGLGGVWKQSVYPLVAALANWCFTYWWAGLYLTFLVVVLPVVATIYVMTNWSASMLGNNVRPLPGKHSYVRFQHTLRRLAKASMRSDIVRKLWLYR